MKRIACLSAILAAGLLAGTAHAQSSINKNALPQFGSPTALSTQNGNDLSVAEEAPAGNAYLGVMLEDNYVEVPSDRVKSDLHWGAQIKNLVPDSPAQEAGLKVGDLVLGVGDREIRSSQDLHDEISKHQAGDKVELRILRDDKEEKISATLKAREPAASAPDPRNLQQLSMPQGMRFGAMPNMTPADFDGIFEQLRAQMDQLQNTLPEPGQIRRGLNNGGGYSNVQSYSMTSSDSRLGVVLQNLTPQLGEFFGVPNGAGALVATVEPDTAASAAGIVAGDVITSIDGQKISTPMDAQAAVMNAPDNTLSVELIREKKTLKLEATTQRKDNASASQALKM